MKRFLVGAIAFFAVSVSAQSHNAPVSRSMESGTCPNVTDDEGVSALMLATLYADAACVEVLLKRGANPNQADPAGATALMWAIPDITKVQRLIEYGASVNARSSSLGRTPLLIAAGYPGTVDLLRLLLAHGADLRAKDLTGVTALAMAMQSADVEVLRFLVDSGLDPKDEVPAAVLRGIVRHRPAVVDYLMSRRVAFPKDVLVRVSSWQSPDLIEQWIQRGADVNARDPAYGRTALFTAAASDRAGAETLRVLLERGANPNVETTEGERPLDWAVYRADPAKVAVLEKYGATRGQGPRRPVVPPTNREVMADARRAVSRSVSLLLNSAPPMFEKRRCFACHHNTLPAEAAALARRKGIAVDEGLVRKNREDILAVFRLAAGPAMQAQATTIPGAMALTVGYGLMALAAEAYPLDKATASMVHWILSTQMPDGSWLGNGIDRPPMESSTVSHTTIAVRGLTLYPIFGLKPELDRALEKAQHWLLTAKADSAEDRAMRLMGLVWTKAPGSAVEAASQEIRRQQAATGGWSQLSVWEPDAYATGLSLFALNEAGLRVTDAVYRKGVEFLLRSQYPDGSWLVRTRSFPTQPYFESGFPFGPHQWISAAGTAWAARAIAATLPDGTEGAR